MPRQQVGSYRGIDDLLVSTPVTTPPTKELETSTLRAIVVGHLATNNRLDRENFPKGRKQQ
jgi:hypothetical protein